MGGGGGGVVTSCGLRKMKDVVALIFVVVYRWGWGGGGGGAGCNNVAWKMSKMLLR